MALTIPTPVANVAFHDAARDPLPEDARFETLDLDHPVNGFYVVRP